MPLYTKNWEGEKNLRKEKSERKEKREGRKRRKRKEKKKRKEKGKNSHMEGKIGILYISNDIEFCLKVIIKLHETNVKILKSSSF